MARVYRYCLLTSKQCPCGFVYPRDRSDSLGRIRIQSLVFCLPKGLLQLFLTQHSTYYFLLTQVNFFQLSIFLQGFGISLGIGMIEIFLKYLVFVKYSLFFSIVKHTQLVSRIQLPNETNEPK